MAGSPSGLWLTMTCVIEGVSVVAIAYKYNSKKVLHFCCPVGAGSACAGEPYVAIFTDEHGNVCTRDVLRCVIACATTTTRLRSIPLIFIGSS